MAKNMKNKMRFWRKIAKKTYDGATEIRTGRQLRDAIQYMNQPLHFLPIHNRLFKNAGIGIYTGYQHKQKSIVWAENLNI